jgi:hypothetical protein
LRDQLVDSLLTSSGKLRAIIAATQVIAAILAVSGIYGGAAHRLASAVPVEGVELS